MAERRARAARALLLTGALLLGACASEGQRREDDLAELLAWLPGRYDNAAQAQREQQAGLHPGHDRIELQVIPVDTPRLGHHVFYVQENAPDNPERVMSERLFSFDIDEKRGIIGLMYNFADPLRWRDGARAPQMFTSVMADDMVPVGCELIWKRSGETFSAAYDPKHCHRAGASGASGPEATLTADSLTFSGYEFKKH